jgi:hypothetical protein
MNPTDIIRPKNKQDKIIRPVPIHPQIIPALAIIIESVGAYPASISLRAL